MLSERAPGKINLCLFLGQARASDVRHELVSVMQAVTLADELTLEPADRDEIVCPGVEGPNLAADALRVFRAATGWDEAVRITIDKRVPVAAGMGGGSGDAAATLRLAVRASGVGDDVLLHHLAATLGADVPAQLRPGRVLATGAGEQVERLAPGPPLGVLVLPGDNGLSTAAVYREADRLGLERDDLPSWDERVAKALGAGGTGHDASAADLSTELLVNDLEPAARSLDPTIDDRLDAARAAGADHAMVSGSGPTVIGLFSGVDGPARAARAADASGGIACEGVR